MGIQNDVPIPTFFEEPAKKGRKKAEPKAVDQVLENLKLLGLIAKKTGTVQETHISIRDGFATASLGELTIGCPLPFSVNAVVKHHDLLEAKKVAGSEFACTETDGRLVIVANDLRMVVGMDDSGVWASPPPDQSIAPACDRLRTVLVELAPFATADRPELVGVLCQANTAVGCNGYAVLEIWHGVDMPPNIRLPVTFLKKISRIKRQVVSFGFCDYSFTLWFEDGSFIRTAQHPGQYADYWLAFSDTTEFDLVDLPIEFYKALKSIVPFAKDGVVYFKDGQIYTAKQTESASSFKHEAIPNGFGFNVNYLLMIANHAPTVKFMHNCEGIQFECGNARGAVKGLDMRPPQHIATPEQDAEYNDHFEDDIPY